MCLRDVPRGLGRSLGRPREPLRRLPGAVYPCPLAWGVAGKAQKDVQRGCASIGVVCAFELAFRYCVNDPVIFEEDNEVGVVPAGNRRVANGGSR